MVGGIYEDERGHVEHLLLGLYDDAGKLNYIGRCPAPGSEAEIRKKLKPVMGGAGFTGHKPQPVNRWTEKKHTAVMLKPKLVLEASADHVAGGRMRHGSRFMRWRPIRSQPNAQWSRLPGSFCVLPIEETGGILVVLYDAHGLEVVLGTLPGIAWIQPFPVWLVPRWGWVGRSH